MTLHLVSLSDGKYYFTKFDGTTLMNGIISYKYEFDMVEKVCNPYKHEKFPYVKLDFEEKEYK